MQHSAGMRSQVGEFWYKLSLKATQPAPTVISGLVCEIGKRVEVVAMLFFLRYASVRG